MKNEAGHRALSKTLAVDLLVTVRNPAVCVDATFPASCCILVFSLTVERYSWRRVVQVELESGHGIWEELKSNRFAQSGSCV